MTTFTTSTATTFVVEPCICCGSYLTADPNSDDPDCNTYCESCEMWGSLRFIEYDGEGGWSTTNEPRNPIFWRCDVHGRSEGTP